MPDTPRPSKRRTIRWLIATIAASLLLPYGYSRLASSSRRVSVHRNTRAAKVNNRIFLKVPVRIACYNIAHGRGTAESNWAGGSGEAKTKRLDEIAALLRSIDADIVVLNEVDFDCSWSHGVNQAAYLAKRAAYPYWAEQRNLDVRVLLWTWKFGNAVLSKHPIRNAAPIEYPSYSSWESFLGGKKRGLVCEVGDGRAVKLFAIHLSHRSEAVRVNSVDLIAGMMRNSKLPVIAAGDFNSTPTTFPHSATDAKGNNAIERMPAILQSVPDRVPESSNEMTFHTQRPHRVIDWVFIPKGWTLVNFRVDSSNLSDHRPVIVDANPNL